MNKNEFLNIKPLASGGEADIFEMKEDRILRVLRRGFDKPFDVEKKLAPIWKKHEIKVPEIYEYTEYENRPAQIMQRIYGESFLDSMKKDFFHGNDKIAELAKLHSEVLAIQTDVTILSMDQVFYYCYEAIEKKNSLSSSICNQIKKIYETLEKGNHLCHGDFHPGNILVQEKTQDKYVIDWSGAHVGNPVSDVAHTYLLMSSVPKIPGQKKLEYQAMKTGGNYIAKRYVNYMKAYLKFSKEEWDAWCVVMAFLRIIFGLPDERENRIQYILEKLPQQ